MPGKEISNLWNLLDCLKRVSGGLLPGASYNPRRQTGDVIRDEVESLEEPVVAHVLVSRGEDNLIILPLLQIWQKIRERPEARNFSVVEEGFDLVE